MWKKQRSEGLLKSIHLSLQKMSFMCIKPKFYPHTFFSQREIEIWSRWYRPWLVKVRSRVHVSRVCWIPVCLCSLWPELSLIRKIIESLTFHLEPKKSLLMSGKEAQESENHFQASALQQTHCPTLGIVDNIRQGLNTARWSQYYTLTINYSSIRSFQSNAPWNYVIPWKNFHKV